MGEGAFDMLSRDDGGEECWILDCIGFFDSILVRGEKPSTDVKVNMDTERVRKRRIMANQVCKKSRKWSFVVIDDWPMKSQ